MALPLYLALTAAEFQNCSSLPGHTAWMACHYSSYGLGLSNRPQTLPKGSMLILNDRTPPMGHNPELITRQLSESVSTFQCGSVLMDFQRPDIAENSAVVRELVAALPCPVGVSEPYAHGLDCPVFLPPIPPHISLEEFLSPWRGREVWLEAALVGEVITVTEQGAVFESAPSTGQAEHCLADKKLHCHYRIEPEETRIRFHLFRTQEDLAQLLSAAESQGVTQAVGLYQELSDFVTQ